MEKLEIILKKHLITSLKTNIKLKGVKFLSCDYRELKIPINSIVYCDPPYDGTKEYIEAVKSGFNPVYFWDWCREVRKLGHKVFVSEYNAPYDFECIWEKEVKSSLGANGVTGGSKKSIEKLFTLK